MGSFNLIDESWIPCLAAGKPCTVSLREAVTEAGEIEKIADVSPLTTVAIYRLLLAIVHRVCDGPKQTDDWEDLWDARTWDVAAAETYLKTWHHRFNLLDSDWPFFQQPHIVADWSAPQRLSHELGPANAEMFIDVRQGTPMEPAEAARYLLAYQLFSPGGLVGLQREEDKRDRTRYKYARTAPLASSAVCVVRGKNLAETVLLNMVPYDPSKKLPFQGELRDAPVWERDDHPQVVARRPTGLLDWLTWQCRRIRLRACEQDGRTMVDGVLIMKGDQLPPDVLEYAFEQMVAYRVVHDTKPPQNPFPPIGFERDRAVWRDSSALVGSVAPEGKAKGQQRPKTIEALSSGPLVGDDTIPAFPFDLFGVSLEQFNALFWRHERLAVPPRYLTDATLHNGLQNALRLAEQSARVVNAAVRRLAELLLTKGTDRRPDPNAVSALVDGMGAGRRYWAKLGSHFPRFLADQALPGKGPEARQAWAEEVRRGAWDVFEEIARGQAGSGATLRAIVVAEATLKIGLARARTDHLGDQKGGTDAVA